ncbi:MAG TPA: hypothetical protein VER14_08650 [Phototrophicaceae bacterium]|nr:hypothetical protein [Phototrophicaceae bacterium]
MRIISAIATAPSMTEEEIDRFLESKLNLQLASIDKKGIPIFSLFGLAMINHFKKFL